MVEEMPFASPESLLSVADSAWRDVSDEDRLEAFAAHPRIGGKKAETDTGSQAADWSKGEQAAVAGSDNETTDRLAELNAQYFDKHGFIFIICATGRSAPEMLAALEKRLENPTSEEIQHAAKEQAAITKLRLNKWLHGS